MNKLFKGMLTTFLAVGFLAACGGGETSNPSSEPLSETSNEPDSVEVITHLVTFWEDTVGRFYDEVEVEDGKTVVLPTDPAREGYIFEGWFLKTEVLSEEGEIIGATYDVPFLAAQKIRDDLDVYGNWTKEYVPDTRTFHIIGDLQNTEYENTWNTGADHYTNTHMTVADDKNLFTIELEIGYMGKFKVKEPGEGWDDGQEYDFTDIPEGQVPEYVIEGDTRNVQVKTAGLYKVEVETDLGELSIVRLGDAVGAGVKQDPDPNSILAWGLVGTPNNWGATPDIQPEYIADPGFHLFRSVYLEVGAAFKFRVGADWATQIGYNASVVLPDGIVAETEGDPATPKSGGNFIVETEGFYTMTIKTVELVHTLVIEPTEFVLRGTALPTGWDADFGTPLAFLSKETVEEVTTYTYEGTFDLLAGEFKVKVGQVGTLYSGWDNAFGDGAGNFVVAAAGSYKVTLVVTVDPVTHMFVGTATVVAAPVVE